MCLRTMCVDLSSVQTSGEGSSLSGLYSSNNGSSQNSGPLLKKSCGVLQFTILKDQQLFWYLSYWKHEACSWLLHQLALFFSATAAATTAAALASVNARTTVTTPILRGSIPCPITTPYPDDRDSRKRALIVRGPFIIIRTVGEIDGYQWN